MTGSIKTTWEVKNGSICKEQKMDGIGRNWTGLKNSTEFDGIRMKADGIGRQWTDLDGIGQHWTALYGIGRHFWTALNNIRRHWTE